MNLYRLAVRNISGSAFRSWVVAICAFMVAGFALGTVLVLRGAEQSLQLAISRLGADIIIVPEGTQTKVESALLMGNPTRVWMPADTLQKVASVEGVQTVSPQLFLSPLVDAACCSVSKSCSHEFEVQSSYLREPLSPHFSAPRLRAGLQPIMLKQRKRCLRWRHMETAAATARNE